MLRQRVIANILICTNIFLGVLLIAAVQAWEWDFSFSGSGLSAFSTPWAVSVLLLLASSGFVPSLVAWARDLEFTPHDTMLRQESFIDTARKYIFYPAVYLNLAAIAVLVEQSGGLISSPFSAVFFALVLAGQQLGRFRTNSVILICAGTGASLALLAYEGVFGVRAVEAPPRQLSFFILAAAFLAASIITHLDKRPNYRAEEGWPAPSLVEVYVDGDGVWWLALYGSRAKLDYALSQDDEMLSVDGAKARAQAYLQERAGILRLEDPGIRWTVPGATRDLLGAVDSKGRVPDPNLWS